MNVTELLVAECRNPDRTIKVGCGLYHSVDLFVKVEGSALGGLGALGGLHLHEPAQAQQGQTAF